MKIPSSFKKSLLTITLMAVILTIYVIITDSNFNAKMFPYDSNTWNSIMEAQEKRGLGKLRENAEIAALRGKVFYTYRTAYKVNDWKILARKQAFYANIEQGELSNWKDPLRPEEEPKSGIQLPWLITNYDYGTESVRIKPAPFDCFVGKGKSLADKNSYLLCFGDPTPIIKTYDDGNTFNPRYGDVWQWLDEKVLDLKLNEQESKKILDSLSGSSFTLKVYYTVNTDRNRSKPRINIVWIEGFTDGSDSKKFIFRTNKYQPRDHEQYNLAGKPRNYWNDFTR